MDEWNGKLSTLENHGWFGFARESTPEVFAPGAFKNCDTVFYSPSAIRRTMEEIGYPDYLIDRVINKLEED